MYIYIYACLCISDIYIYAWWGRVLEASSENVWIISVVDKALCGFSIWDIVLEHVAPQAIVDCVQIIYFDNAYYDQFCNGIRINVRGVADFWVGRSSFLTIHIEPTRLHQCMEYTYINVLSCEDTHTATTFSLYGIYIWQSQLCSRLSNTHWVHTTIYAYPLICMQPSV